MLIKCCRCNKRKTHKKFPTSKRTKNGYNCYCRECYNEYFRKYLKNPTHQARVNRNNDRYADAIFAIKLHLGCCVCGYKKHPKALHFHHLDPKTKCFNIGSHDRYGMKILEEEIRKCSIVCANCHAEVTDKIPHNLIPVTIDIRPFFEATKYKSKKD